MDILNNTIMKQIWQDIKDRWPLAVITLLFVIVRVLINL